MGFRPKRSIEVAAKLVIELVSTTQSLKGMASLLQLDLSSAFDTMDHYFLLATLQSLGFKEGLVKQFASYLNNWTTSLSFDSQLTDPILVLAGVSQGLPLLSLLFILFITPLFREVNIEGASLIGFADDTNILAYSKDTIGCITILQKAYTQIKAQAQSRGLVFNASKSELIHFSRKRKAPTLRCLLGSVFIQPKVEARFLGVWLDRNLNWQRQARALKKKLPIEAFTLTRLTATIQGCKVQKDRELYTVIIRSTMAYRAGIWHQPSKQPRGLARDLAPKQSKRTFENVASISSSSSQFSQISQTGQRPQRGPFQKLGKSGSRKTWLLSRLPFKQQTTQSREKRGLYLYKRILIR